MTDSPLGTSPFRRPPRRYQFGLAALLLAAIPVSLLAASLGGMLGRGGAAGRLPAGYFVLMCIATPLGLMVAASLLRQLLLWWKRRGPQG